MSYLKTAQEKKQLCFTYLAFMLNGILALSIGSLLPFIRDAKGLNYAFAGMIVSLHSVGNLFSSFASGTLSVFLGRKKSILLFNACYALSYVMILYGNSNVMLALAFLMTGLARGASSNFANYTVNSLAPGKAGFLNALHAMFSIGAFLFPILLTVLTRADAGHWIYACYFLIVMGILSWILYFLIPSAEAPKEKLEKKKSDSSVDFGGASYGCESVGEGQKRKAAADNGRWICGIFLLAAIFEKHFADCCRYYGIWIQYGGDLSDNGVILRQIDSEVFNGVEFYFDNGELWIDFDADDYRKDCGTCGYCVWNELDCRGRAGGFGIDCGS